MYIRLNDGCWELGGEKYVYNVSPLREICIKSLGSSGNKNPTRATTMVRQTDRQTDRETERIQPSEAL